MKYFLKVKINLSQSQKYLNPEEKQYINLGVYPYLYSVMYNCMEYYREKLIKD